MYAGDEIGWWLLRHPLQFTPRGGFPAAAIAIVLGVVLWLFGYPLAHFLAVADLDGENGPDVAVTNRADDQLFVLLNGGDGTFAPHVPYGAGDEPVSVALGDLDGDGDLDMAVANRSSDDVSVLLSNGDGTFAEDVTYVEGEGLRFVAVDDLDGDGDLDLAVVGSRVLVLLNECPPELDCNGNGVPDACDIAAGTSVDADGDGVPDECG